MEGDTKKFQPLSNTQCPICKRPMQDKKPGEKKLRFAEFGWVIALVIVVIIVVGILAAFLVANLPTLNPTTTTYSSEVIIAEGGHFKYDLGWAFTDSFQIKLNVSSENSEKFDVYIMDDNGYFNAYNPSNESIIAFSAYYSRENITNINDTLSLPFDRNYYLVIDNRDTPLTPDDATPTGPLTVSVYLEIENELYLD
jgi:hypothetical protein